jgi:hypothetical protein
MKTSQICAMALLLVMGSVMAFADGIQDPKIIVRGVGSGNLAQDCRQGCMDVGINFSFQIPKGGSGSLFFTNTSGKNWTSLSLIETGEPASAISCVQNIFLNCSTKTLKNGSVEILLSGVKHSLNPRVGIPNGSSFEITFNCAEGCWVNGGSTVTGHAGAAPEPETVALMVTGLGAIISQRKRWMSRLKA